MNFKHGQTGRSPASDQAAQGRVQVRGDGIVGCAAALALSKLGIPVEMLVQTTATASGEAAPAAERALEVRTYALNAASVALLRELRIWEALPQRAVCPVLEMRIHGDQAGELEFSAWQQGQEALAWIVDAAALEDSLRQALRFAPHVRVTGSAAQPGRLQSPRDLLLVCEGRDAKAREELGVRFERQPYGHHALATRVVGSQPHAGVASQWFAQPDVLALLPCDEPQAGRSYGVVWSMPQDKAQALLSAEGPVFEQWLQQATGGRCGPLALAGARRCWPLSLGRADPTHGPGWILLGDAAHTVHPLAGQGLNLGLSDVAALQQVMAEREEWRDLGDERLLARVSRLRAGPTLAMSGLTDGLWHLFANSNPWVRSLRNRGMTLLNQSSTLKRSLARRAAGLAIAGLGVAAALFAMAGAGLAPQPAWAQSPSPGAASPAAQEALIRRQLAERMPGMPKPDEVQRSAVPGLWELRFGNDILYTDERADYLVSGSIIDTRTRKDLTAERLERLSTIAFDSLPLKDAIVIRQGTGARKLVVFSDPNCGFCKRFERDLMGIKDVTLYTYLYPILGKDSMDKSRNIWCAADPAKAWRDWMVDGRMPPAASGRCDASALERNVALGRRHRIDGTPTSIFEDGSRRGGALAGGDIDRLLAQVKGAKP